MSMTTTIFDDLKSTLVAIETNDSAAVDSPFADAIRNESARYQPKVRRVSASAGAGSSAVESERCTNASTDATLCSVSAIVRGKSKPGVRKMASWR